MDIPKWLHGVSCTKINAVAWRLAAALAACLALLAAFLTERPQGSGALPEPSLLPVSPSKPATGPPLEEFATENTPGGQVDRLIHYCSGLVNQTRSFVVFSNGTCVVVNEPSRDPIAEAYETLQQCAGPSAPFVTTKIDDGDYIVAYQKAAFHCLFLDEIEESREEIESDFRRYLGDKERASCPTGWEPPFHAKLGLVGRSRLNADARTPRVAKVIKALPLPVKDVTGSEHDEESTS